MNNVNYGKCCTGLNIANIEHLKNAKYVGDFCIKTRSGNWSELPVSIFYVEYPEKPEYTNYFGMFVQNGKVLITDGSSAFLEPIEGVVANNGEIVYSRFRHDFRSSTDGSVWIDGGRDYCRCGVYDPIRRVKLIIKKDKLVVAP